MHQNEWVIVVFRLYPLHQKLMEFVQAVDWLIVIKNPMLVIRIQGQSANPVKLVLEQLDIDITKFAEKFALFVIWKLLNFHSEEGPSFHIIQQHKWEAKWIVLFN
uniref:Uncharacterized protein n=1 Tax=Coccidioides posadasii RMSCC 3488 TaxID=454284 RepID=A0A0J6IK07_COCPO|nr:hypothetical protein CPAG_08559 [Coccidioides posadasii RMSCC 3488]